MLKIVIDKIKKKVLGFNSQNKSFSADERERLIISENASDDDKHVGE